MTAAALPDLDPEPPRPGANVELIGRTADAGAARPVRLRVAVRMRRSLALAGAGVARATPYVLGFLVVAGVAGLLCYWVVDRAASRDQIFKRAGVFLLGVAVLLVVLVLAGVVAPEELFAGNGGGQ